MSNNRLSAAFDSEDIGHFGHNIDCFDSTSVALTSATFDCTLQTYWNESVIHESWVRQFQSKAIKKDYHGRKVTNIAHMWLNYFLMTTNLFGPRDFRIAIRCWSFFIFFLLIKLLMTVVCKLGEIQWFWISKAADPCRPRTMWFR